MEKLKIVRYCASDERSYKEIAHLAGELSIEKAEFSPSKREIVIVYRGEASEAEKAVGSMIKRQSLSVAFAESDDSLTGHYERQLADLKEAVEEATRRAENREKWWIESERKVEKARKALTAMAVLVTMAHDSLAK